MISISAIGSMHMWGMCLPMVGVPAVALEAWLAGLHLKCLRTDSWMR